MSRKLSWQGSPWANQHVFPATGRALNSGTRVAPPKTHQCCKVPKLPLAQPGPILSGTTHKFTNSGADSSENRSGKTWALEPFLHKPIPASPLTTKQDLSPLGKGWEALRAKLLVSPELLRRGHKVSSTYGKRGGKISENEKGRKSQRCTYDSHHSKRFWAIASTWHFIVIFQNKAPCSSSNILNLWGHK